MKYSSWTGVALNEVLLERDSVATALLRRGITPLPFRTPDIARLLRRMKAPKHKVIEFGAHVGIRPIRDICSVVCTRGKWFARVAANIGYDRVYIGGYGYESQLVVHVTPHLVRIIKRRGFSRRSFARLVREKGTIICEGRSIRLFI